MLEKYPRTKRSWGIFWSEGEFDLHSGEVEMSREIEVVKGCLSKGFLSCIGSNERFLR